MTYIYDILLNFTDDDKMIEFYEWQEDDFLEHVKRIPLIRISSEEMEKILNNKIQVTKEFLEQIKDRTLTYKLKNDLKYAVLVSDLNKALALEFNNEGIIISKSTLLLDEEEDVIDECSLLEVENLTLKCLSKYQIDYFLTRQEKSKKNYLLKELETLKKEQNLYKFNYLYEEIFSKDDLSFSERYEKFIVDITTKYSNKYNKLYEIVRMTYLQK